MILPAYQPILWAMQYATVDILSGRRLHLVLGIDWNCVKYEDLHENFRKRERRSKEQISLLRDLWIKDCVDFEGRWNR